MTQPKIRVFGVVNDSIVDGPGLRYAVFTQGCHHACPGCHNPESHAMDGGYEKSIEDILKEIDDNPLLDGITLSGGEPMLQAKELCILAKEIKKRDLTIIIYSGFTFEEILAMDGNQLALLEFCDMLVDGRFEIEKKSLTLLYRGSSNQRLINIQESLKQNQVICYQPDEYGQIEI